MTAGVYLLRCLRDGRVYVGSSGNVRRRYYGHRSLLRRRIHFSSSLQAAWDCDGPEGFDLVLLAECGDEAERLRIEEAEIARREATDPAKGFNTSPLASATLGVSRPKTAEHRAKLSAAQIGREKTEPELRRIAEGQRRRLADPEAREVLRRAKLGYQHTDAALAKIADAARGKTHSPETRERMREAARRRWADPELGQRLRASFEEAKRKGRESSVR